MSYAINAELSNSEREMLQGLTAEFAKQGGRLFIGAGNDARNGLVALPGVIGVDGSEGYIGGPTNNKPSSIYKNGDHHDVVANSFIRPTLTEDSGIDINGDGKSDFSAEELAPMVPAPLEGQQQVIVTPDQLAALRQGLSAFRDSVWDNPPSPQAGEQIEHFATSLAQRYPGGVVAMVKASWDAESDVRVPHFRALSDVMMDGHGGVVESPVYSISPSGTLQRAKEADIILGTSFATPWAVVQDLLSRGATTP